MVSITQTKRDTRTTFALTGAPDVGVEYASVTIRPDEAVVSDRDGVVWSVEVSGWRVLKSGALSSSSRHYTRFYSAPSSRGTNEELPEFVQALIAAVEVTR